MRKTLLPFILFAVLVPVTATAGVYRWVDENGVTHYGDRVPPKFAKKRREELSERGHVISVREREPTAEERAATRARLEQEEREKAAAEKQAQRDRSLTATYDNVEKLDTAYTRRLDIVAGKIQAAEKTLSDIQATLGPLYQRKSGGNAEEGLDKRIKQTEERLRKQQEVVDRLHVDMDNTRRQFQADRERYLEIAATRN